MVIVRVIPLFIYLFINIYKIKGLSVHWFKSPQILDAHVSSKVIKENTVYKIVFVCLSVIFCVHKCGHKHGRRYSHEILYLD